MIWILYFLGAVQMWVFIAGMEERDPAPSGWGTYVAAGLLWPLLAALFLIALLDGVSAGGK